MNKDLSDILILLGVGISLVSANFLFIDRNLIILAWFSVILQGIITLLIILTTIKLIKQLRVNYKKLQ